MKNKTLFLGPAILALTVLVSTQTSVRGQDQVEKGKAAEERAGEKEEKSPPSSNPQQKGRPVVSTPEPVKPFTVESLDTDKSGDVSKEEFIAYQLERLEAVFKYLDKDKDKKLDAVELDQMMRRSSTRPPLPPRQQ